MASPKKIKVPSLADSIAIGMLVIGILSLGYTVWHDYTEHRSNDKEFGKIETALRVLTETVAPQIYKSVDDSLNASLVGTPSEASVALNSAKSQLRQLQDSRVAPDFGQLMQSGALLSKVASAHPDLPETWQLATQLVNYKYENRTSSSSPLPNCLDAVTQGRNRDVVQGLDGSFKVTPGFSSEQLGSWMSHIWLGHCTLDLDDDGNFYSTSVGMFFADVKRHHPNANLYVLVINDAVIKYSGGKMIPVNQLQFTNCTFEFDQPTQVPSGAGQALTSQLLATNESEGTVQLLGM